MRKIISILLALFIIFMISVTPINSKESNIVFSKNKEATKKIALTFDDGPHPRYTEKILNILAKYNVKATFFVIGVNIENYPEPLKEASRRGHEIGNHSYSHNNEKDLTEESVREEIEKCEALIYKATGKHPKLFRPPQGKYGEQVKNIAQEKGYSIILWSIDTKDWEHTPAIGIGEIVSAKVSNGDIILMHDYTSGKNTTCDALEIIIPDLLSRGYEFVTVSELLTQS